MGMKMQRHMHIKSAANHVNRYKSVRNLFAFVYPALFPLLREWYLNGTRSGPFHSATKNPLACSVILRTVLHILGQCPKFVFLCSFEKA